MVRFVVSEEFLKLTLVQHLVFIRLHFCKKKKKKPNYFVMVKKKGEVPMIELWLTELTGTLHLERIRCALKNKILLFEKIWSPFISSLHASD